MPAAQLIVPLLLVLAFTLATWLESWFQGWAGNRAQSANVLAVALGDSRRLFAKHFYVKADAYFHNGYYPTIYDNNEGFETAHIAEETKESHEDEEEVLDFMGKPKDWLDRFSRHFYPARHTHLGDSGCGHSCCQRPNDGHTHDHSAEDHDSSKRAERELLPWLRLSAELDPQRVETYVVSAYWLRRGLGKVNEAEQFLREGLQANPGDCEILFELGRIYVEDRKDLERARNVWELALHNWHEREQNSKEPNVLLQAQLLGNLAKLEEQQKNYAKALDYLKALKEVSPHKEQIQKWLQELKVKQQSLPGA